MKSTILNFKNIKERGTLEMEFLALLLVLGLIVSATTSFHNTIRMRKINNKLLKNQLESFKCSDLNKIECKIVRLRATKYLKHCKSIQQAEKCSYLSELEK